MLAGWNRVAARADRRDGAGAVAQDARGLLVVRSAVQIAQRVAAFGVVGVSYGRILRRRPLMRDKHRIGVLISRQVHARALDADLLQADHEVADELVAALKTQQLVLPVGLVEEDDVERDGEVFGHFTQLRQDVAVELALFGADELEEPVAELLDLLEGGAELDDDGDGLGEGPGAALVQDEEGVQVAVWGLDDVALHFLEFGVEEGDLLDVVVVALHVLAGVAVDGDAVADVKGVLHEDEDDAG